jgi:[ribosomal protein S5]-alanine N-acetyltransferase
MNARYPIIPSLDTPHLILRPWKLDDVDALYRILQEPEILKYFPPTVFTLEKTQRYIQHQLQHWQVHGYGHWAVMIKTDSQVVGWDGLEYLPETDEVEVAYLLSHRVWGCGYATEAARAAVNFGFGNANLPSIIGLVHPENTGSIRVLEKSGLSFIDCKIYWGLEMRRYRIESSLHVEGNTSFSSTG